MSMKPSSLDLPSKRLRAQRSFYKAIKLGIINRKPCCICGKDQAHGHHFDYDKPLEVMWFCNRHHAQHHYILRWLKDDGEWRTRLRWRKIRLNFRA